MLLLPLFLNSVLTIKLLLLIVSNTSNLLWKASQKTTGFYYFLIPLVSYSTWLFSYFYYSSTILLCSLSCYNCNILLGLLATVYIQCIQISKFSIYINLHTQTVLITWENRSMNKNKVNSNNGSLLNMYKNTIVYL